MNIDVIYSIFPWLDKNTLLSFMSTCHACREYGVRYLLSFNLPLTAGEIVPSFGAFLFANGSRVQHLRKLRIALTFPSKLYEPAEDLKSIILAARSLESLELTQSTTYVLKPDFFSSVVSLPRLIRLKLEFTELSMESDNSIMTMLNISTLTELGIVFHPRANNPLQWLPHSMLSNLTSLSLGNCRLDDETTETQFRNMQTLSLYSTDTVDTASILFIFPNLCSLDIKTDFVGLRPGADATELEIVRLANIEAQNENSWPQLTRLSGDLNSLYAYAIKTHLHTLCVERIVALEDFLPLLHAVLMDARPLHLELSGNAYRITLEMLQEMFPADLQVTHVVLRVCLVNKPKPVINFTHVGKLIVRFYMRERD
jgi:hypothetical protein